MWIVYAIVVHALLLGAIFVIYFRSPVIRGLTAQNAIELEAPARRLVLFVMDGLRAESFFHEHCKDIPHLRRIFHKGLVGVSHTRVPTESRPGHIALIAGMYEDPSAVMTGWKENPIDFDTVFNRSASTFAWGANDVLHIFSRLAGTDHARFHIDVYDHDLDFSGRDSTHALDEWVFERVRQLLERKGAALRQKKQMVFFLHLLGLDTAGHVHKPGSSLFLENLHRTEAGIFEIFERFEATFPDGHTAYVLTSDHGMTDAGSHGGGGPHETETPFFLWGAGIPAHPHYDDTINDASFQVADEDKSTGAVTLPLHAIEQAQMAPFMSALLGLPPPMNNFGKLPIHFLNTSIEYRTQAIQSNALQLLEQFRVLLAEHERGFFTMFLRSYDKLNRNSIAEYQQLTKQRLENGRRYEDAILDAQIIIDNALDGINFYHGYYQHFLLLAVVATYVGWIFYLFRLLFQRQLVVQHSRSSSYLSKNLIILGVSCFILATLQGIPWIMALYFILPLFVWQLALIRNGQKVKNVFILFKEKCLIIECCLLVGSIELMVCAFFDRHYIALAYICFVAATCFGNTKKYLQRAYILLPFAVCLMLMPILTSVYIKLGSTNNWLHFLGIVAVLVRPWIMGQTISIPRQVKLITIFALANGMLCSYQHSQQIGISIVSQFISWSFLIYVVFYIFRQQSQHNNEILSSLMKQRIDVIEFLWMALYTLFCLSYETLFVLLLCTELKIALPLRLRQNDDQNIANQQSIMSERELTKALRIAFIILIYTFYSFFGTGNIASISSFDPNVIRCFLTTFSPFIIMILVIVKLVIPIVLVLSIIFGHSRFARHHEREIFICMLLICDLMGMNFLFLVRNRGSWLEIGTSISHFVIMQATTLVLVVLTQIIKICLPAGKNNHRT